MYSWQTRPRTHIDDASLRDELKNRKTVEEVAGHHLCWVADRGQIKAAVPLGQQLQVIQQQALGRFVQGNRKRVEAAPQGIFEHRSGALRGDRLVSGRDIGQGAASLQVNQQQGYGRRRHPRYS